MRSRRAMSRPPRADARSAWSSRPRRGLRLLLPQSRQPPARDVLEALAELLLRLNQRRARQDEHGVLLFHAGRDLNVVLIGQARLDRHRGDVEVTRSEEHTSELQSRFDLVCRLLLEK